MTYKTITLPEGKTISFEVDIAPGPLPVSRLSDTVEDIRKTFGTSVDAIRDFAALIASELRSGLADSRPDGVEISFGIKLSAELSTFIVAKTGGEAHFAVTVKWNSASSTPGAAIPNARTS